MQWVAANPLHSLFVVPNQNRHPQSDHHAEGAPRVCPPLRQLSTRSGITPANAGGFKTVSLKNAQKKARTCFSWRPLPVQTLLPKRQLHLSHTQVRPSPRPFRPREICGSAGFSPGESSQLSESGSGSGGGGADGGAYEKVWEGAGVHSGEAHGGQGQQAGDAQNGRAVKSSFPDSRAGTDSNNDRLASACGRRQVTRDELELEQQGLSKASPLPLDTPGQAQDPLRLSAEGVAPLRSPHAPALKPEAGDASHLSGRRQRPLWKLLPFVRPWLPTILRAWLCTAVAVTSLLLFVPRVGELSSLLGQGDLARLLRKALPLLGLVGSRAIAQYWQDTWLWETALGVTLALRLHAFNAVQYADMAAFEGRGESARTGGAPAGGDVAYRLTAEAESAGDTAFAVLNALVPAAAQLVAMAARMVTLSPLLTAATALVVPGMAGVIAVLGERQRQFSKEGQDSVAALSAYVNEVLPNMLVIKAHAAEPFEAARFRALAQRDRAARFRKKRLKALFPQAITAVYALAVVSLFAVATWAIRRNSLSPAGMVSFLMSLVLLIDPIQAVGTAYNEIKQGEPAVERLFALCSLKPKVVEEPGACQLENVQGNVEFRNVSFQYASGEPLVLSSLSLGVEAGETVALVGPSGGGKTTLFKLLLRLYDPTQGSVLIDGQDLRHVTLPSLRQRVGIVPQETALLSGTVTENIAYGISPEDVDPAAVARAARLANADEFIGRLPQGFETQLGDRAVTLSGGQRQRLAIARAVYHEPSILILDEATSALDNQSEELVREALERLMEDRTVLVIAHRLETVRSADRIVYLEGGQIREEGTHESLMQKGGSYSALYSKQARILP